MKCKVELTEVEIRRVLADFILRQFPRTLSPVKDTMTFFNVNDTVRCSVEFTTSPDEDDE